MPKQKSISDFVAAADNRAAVLSLQDLVGALEGGSGADLPNPIFLHGPSGTGKSHLITALLDEVTREDPSVVAKLIDCCNLGRNAGHCQENDETFSDAWNCDLLVLEDLQHLPPSWWEALVQLLDHRLSHGQVVLLSACVGPRHLGYRGECFPNRLVSRLAAGLVVGLGPLPAEGRRVFLEREAKGRQLVLIPELLSWLAENLRGGGRQLQGVLNQMEQLARMRKEPLDVLTVAQHLADQVEGARPTIEQIALRVSGQFGVAARQLQSRRRSRHILVPRQVGMYLARQLTGLSFEEIGAYFGDRDHSTVLHACRKVENAIDADPALSGAVRQIRAAFV